MTGRPEPLFPLFAGLETLPGIGPKAAEFLNTINIEKPRDLIFHLPGSVIDRRLLPTVQGQTTGSIVSVEATVINHRPNSRKGLPYRITLQDPHTTIELVFFHAQKQYLERLLPEGATRIISGKLEHFEGRAQIAHPDFVLSPEEKNELPEFEPIYALTAGVTQKQMRKALLASLDRLPQFDEWIDGPLMTQQDWPSLRDALQTAHHPQSTLDIAPTAKMRQRLAYDELFAHQITLALARSRARSKSGRATVGDGRLQNRVLSALPYRPTAAQSRAVEEICTDLAQASRMNRLLQGDVGAGKTLVGFMAMLRAVEAGGQAVMMAPTEILARQHLAGLQPLAQMAGVRVEILTGRDKTAQRREKLADLESGAIDILVGTHAVFQKGVEFADLRLAVIDEQHRFGVAQRAALGAKGTHVDVLVMTATPIPRSLALAQYGDMDVSILDEKPAGRQPIKTAAVPMGRLDDVVGKLRAAITEGRQAYWVCPLVEDSEVVDLTSAENRFKTLRAGLGEGVVELIHGQMPAEQKDAAMARFQRGEAKVLVATTVIEVGVDVPNASIMVIERAENFGLAQLHQLRGRVGRGAAASTCLLLYQSPLTETGQRRLNILRETEDGFRIAEEDLKMRGAGDMIGVAQSGLPRFQIADLESQSALLAIAQSDARNLLAQDPKLTSDRGRAVRNLLWLMEQEKAIPLISIG